MKATGRNRRVLAPLSPIFYLFQLPSSTLSRRLQIVLSDIETPPVSEWQHRPGPRPILYGIPEDRRPTVYEPLEPDSLWE
jgi:hypothetical protein